MTNVLLTKLHGPRKITYFLVNESICFKMVLIFTLSSYMIDYVLHARLQVGSYMIVCVMRFKPDMKSGDNLGRESKLLYFMQF